MAFLPKQAADSCIRRANRLLDLAEQKLADSRVKNDLRRSALVTAVTAIDSYMHALILKRADKDKLPKSLERLAVPLQDLMDLANSTVDAQRHNRRSRPWVQVKSSLRKRLLRETFQTYDQLGQALAMAGIENGWAKVATERGMTPAQIKDWLNTIIQKRNQIVHEGDITRAERPRRLKLNKIDHNKTRATVTEIEALISAIDKIV